MAKNTFRKAKRQLTYMKSLAISPSGGGKSFSSLRLATGFAEKLKQLDGKEHRIAYINTEANRGELYADNQYGFDYDILDLRPPFNPEAYIEAMDDAMEAGYDILIIDSLSHEWSGTGGCLELHSNIKGGNSYTNWGKITPRHEAFMTKIIESPIHIFATVRGKDAYEQTTNSNGKTVVEKVAVGYDQRNKLEYLFMTSFMIDLQSHKAEAVKDNTGIFSLNERLSEKHGRLLCEWAYNTTEDDVQKHREQVQKVQDEIKANEEKELEDIKTQSLAEVVEDVITECKAASDRTSRDEVVKLIGGSGNPRKEIKSVEQANELLEKLKGM